MTRLIALLLVCMADGALAEIYRCTDPATGKATFTDVACDSNRATSDTIRVKPGNFGDNGHRAEPRQIERTWRSQDPDRNTGRQPATASREAVQAQQNMAAYQTGGH